MALISIRYYSQELKMQREMYALVPQRNLNGEIGTAYGEALVGKCLYLLHGLSDDHTIWLRRTGIERYAAAYGLTVIMPDADASFYTDMKHGKRYYSHIAKEVPRIAREFLHLSDRREDNFIAGISMGGYGALKIGMRESDAFCACAGLSPVADIHWLASLPEEYDAVFGAGEDIPPQEDLFALSNAHQDDPLRPDIYMAIGTEDFLYRPTCMLRDHLRTLPYRLTYEQSHGDHCWEYWDAQIQYVLAWLAHLAASGSRREE